MNQYQQQKLTAHFQHSFTRGQAHVQSAVNALNSLLKQLQTIVAPQGVIVTYTIHTPMLYTEHRKNVLAEATFTHPQGLQPAVVQFTYSAGLGPEDTWYFVGANLISTYENILRGKNTDPVIEGSDQIHLLLRDIGTIICGFSLS